MVRTGWVVALAVLACGSAHGDDVKVGEPFKGKLEKEFEVPRWPGLANPHKGFGFEIPVKLQEGHKYTFTATVKGEGRKVSLAVINSANQIVKASPYYGGAGTITVTYDEASDTGTFRVVVVSTERGPFTLDSTGPTPSDVTVKALEDDIALLKAVLARKEAALKELKAKKP